MTIRLREYLSLCLVLLTAWLVDVYRNHPPLWAVTVYAVLRLHEKAWHRGYRNGQRPRKGIVQWQ
jgi:hypothetical protein